LTLTSLSRALIAGALWAGVLAERPFLPIVEHHSELVSAYFARSLVTCPRGFRLPSTIAVVGLVA
jgi:hypothetical protein